MTQQLHDAFVPLTAAPAPPAAKEFKVCVLNSENKEAAFQSLTSPASAAAATERKPCEPKVTIQRDGDRITHLRIQCSCGQIMDLACVYDAPATPAT
jgi:hypothetical protein